jgi:hypothetical protein
MRFLCFLMGLFFMAHGHAGDYYPFPVEYTNSDFLNDDLLDMTILDKLGSPLSAPGQPPPFIRLQDPSNIGLDNYVVVDNKKIELSVLTDEQLVATFRQVTLSTLVPPDREVRSNDQKFLEWFLSSFAYKFKLEVVAENVGIAATTVSQKWITIHEYLLNKINKNEAFVRDGKQLYPSRKLHLLERKLGKAEVMGKGVAEARAELASKIRETDGILKQALRYLVSDNKTYITGERPSRKRQKVSQHRWLYTPK